MFRPIVCANTTSPYLVDTAFCANAVDGSKFNTTVFNSIVQANGKVLVGGDFTNYVGTAGRNCLIRLNSDGTLDTAFCANASDGTKFSKTVASICIDSSGKIIIGGAFTAYAGTAGRNCLIRLNSDGTLDTAFCANASDGTKFSAPGTIEVVNSIKIQGDGKILVAGQFTNYGGTSGRNRMIRLNSDGTLDTSFCANAVDGGKFSGTGPYLGINCVEVCADTGKILVGGSFATYNGTVGRGYLLRFNSDGTLDTSFCTNIVDGKFNSYVTVVKNFLGGRTFIGGGFTAYNSTAGRDCLIVLNSNDTLDVTMCAAIVDGSKFNSDIMSVYYTPNNLLVIGGYFFTYGGVANRKGIIAFNPNNTINTAFCTAFSDSTTINNTLHIALSGSGELFFSGTITNYMGVTGRNIFIKLRR